MKIKNNALDLTFATADAHINHNHPDILRMRGVSTREENTEWVINQWNSVVPEDGTVFHLGDFCFTDPDNSITKSVLKRLNYKTLYMLWGNHNSGASQLYREATQHFFKSLGAKDSNGTKYEVYPMSVSVGRNKTVTFVGDYFEASHYSNLIVMFHYAIRNWNKKGKGAWHLCGHSHGNDRYITKEGAANRVLDCGIDTLRVPWSFRQIKEWMLARTFNDSHDHH